MKPVVIITIAFVLLIPTAAFGLEFAEKSDGKNLAGAVIVVVVVLILSVVLANGIWDFTHDAGISNVEIELISCKKTASGSTQTVVKISNYNDHRVLVEWGTIGGFGYADVPAKSFVTDQYYAYGTTECSAAVKSATRG